jgi:exo-1,4-beta-D-glucosaminidase
MTSPPKFVAFFLATLGFVLALFAPAPRMLADSRDATHDRVLLHDGWMLQSSCKVAAKGAQISVTGFRTEGWHVTTVPSTVVAALVADKTFPDPYFGQNLRSIPGTAYPIGKMFSVLPMPRGSPFRCSWWYRTEFRAPDGFDGQRVWLNFGGINNRANIWLNGRRIADSRDVAGAYRRYEFDVTALLVRDRPNVLAVETIAQTEKDLGVNWVDWNPTPPDKDMGLWREVFLRATGPVEIRDPAVATHFPTASLDEADLTVEAELRNASPVPVTGTLEADVEGHEMHQAVTLNAGEARTIRFAPDAFSELRVQNPELWWPHQMGAPVLHSLSLRFLIGEKVSDSVAVRYGIREVTSEIDPQGHLLFRLNGKRILIRGGGWAPDMLLRQSPERLKMEFRYVRDLNLNAIRLEGHMESDAFFDLADEQGILVLAGWGCCDYWMQWSDWKPADLEIAKASLRSQIARLRSHPSMLVWLNGSDEPPPAAVERAYIGILRELDWPNPVLSSASEKFTPITGRSGVKMRGPYDYTPPDYWLADTSKFGGAYGFATEISPGAAVPPFSSLRKMMPADHVVPDDPVWNYHAGSARFQSLRHLEDAMNAIYGAPADFADYERKSQAMAYDSERAMFEAYSRNKYGSTGVIHWMLNNAWPSLIWHLYDYYLQPAGGYFGAKKACEPLHVQYSYDDRSVVVVNSTYQAGLNLSVTAKLFDSALHERFSVTVPVDVPADGVTKAGAFPERAFEPVSPVYFVELALKDNFGEMLSTNFYWLSAKKNVYDWSAEDNDAFTPVKSYEDLTALGTLPSVDKIDGIYLNEEIAGKWRVHAQLRNSSDHLAFQLHIEISDEDQHAEELRLLWDDDYFSLLPGESRDITAQISDPRLMAHKILSVSGWNVEPSVIPPQPVVLGHSRAFFPSH